MPVRSPLCGAFQKSNDKVFPLEGSEEERGKRSVELTNRLQQLSVFLRMFSFNLVHSYPSSRYKKVISVWCLVYALSWNFLLSSCYFFLFHRRVLLGARRSHSLYQRWTIKSVRYQRLQRMSYHQSRKQWEPARLRWHGRLELRLPNSWYKARARNKKKLS